MLTGIFKHLNGNLHYPEDFFELFKEHITDGKEHKIIVKSFYSDRTYKIDNPSILYHHYGSRYSALEVNDNEHVQNTINLLAHHLRSINNPIATQISDSLTIIPLPKNQNLINAIINERDFFTTYMVMCNRISEVALYYLEHPILPETPTVIGDVISKNLKNISFVKKGIVSYVRSFSRRYNVRHFLYKR